jgi:hypothetical protein
MLKGEIHYRDPGPDAYDARQRQRLVRKLHKPAEVLGFALVAIETGELLPAGGVS